MLYMGLLIHTAPRVLEVESLVSRVLGAGQSILAGCSQSMPWIKCYLYDILETAHQRIPKVPIFAYVDDLTQSLQGRAEAVAHTIVPAIVELHQALVDR
eukprot:2729673-Pyramimonas_sp.AAC.1